MSFALLIHNAISAQPIWPKATLLTTFMFQLEAASGYLINWLTKM